MQRPWTGFRHAISLAVVLLSITWIGTDAPLPTRPELAWSGALAPYPDGPLAMAIETSRPAGTALSGFQLLPDGPQALEARIALIDAARRSLDVQYYILSNDSTGIRFVQALRAAARRGVRVRLLIDDLRFGDNERALVAPLQGAGFDVRVFNPLAARRGPLAWRVFRSLREFHRINHRMHNKLLIADGVISISGGRNVADAYFMRDPIANFIDLDVLAAGAVVPQQSEVFDRYWNSRYSYPLASLGDSGVPGNSGHARLQTQETGIDSRDASGQLPVRRQIAGQCIDLAWAHAQVLADAPGKVGRRSHDLEPGATVRSAFLPVVLGARARLLIGSPYFVPGTQGLSVLQGLTRRHVKVTVVTNAFGATDAPPVHAHYASYRDAMLDMGVELYEMSPRLISISKTLGRFNRSQGRLHAKLALVDDRWFFIGSMNFDPRSASLNTEAALLIDSPSVVAQFETLLKADRFRSAYRVIRDAHGRMGWMAQPGDGPPVSTNEEPDTNWSTELWAWLWLTLVDEEWL